MQAWLPGRVFEARKAPVSWLLKLFKQGRVMVLLLCVLSLAINGLMKWSSNTMVSDVAYYLLLFWEVSLWAIYCWEIILFCDYFPLISKAIKAHVKSLKFVEITLKMGLKCCANNTQQHQPWRNTWAGNNVLDETAFRCFLQQNY